MIPTVLVFGGGPDGEREVSIKSSTAIAAGLNASGRYKANLQIIDKVMPVHLRGMAGDLIIPYLHGPYGEGGPLQDVLEQDGRPYFGTGPRGSRLAMDKLASKAAAFELGIPTAPVAVLNVADDGCPLPLPVVIKPVHEGSTLGLHVCMSRADYAAALAEIRAERAKGSTRVYMVECKIGGANRARELTVGLLDNQALPVIEISPKDGLYDYEAKYNRNDTTYLVDPSGVSDTIKKKISKATARIAKALGLRHISRADFMLDADGVAWFLEINTTPGFTDHSLVPKAAAHAGLAMPELCVKLAEMTLRDGKGGKGAGASESAAAAASSSAAAVAAAQDTGDVEQGEG